MLKFLGICSWGLSAVCFAGNVADQHAPLAMLSDEQLSAAHATAIYDHNMIIVSRLLQKISVNDIDHLEQQTFRQNIWDDEITQQMESPLQNIIAVPFEVKILEQNMDYERNTIHIKFDSIHVKQIDLRLNMEGVYQLGSVLNAPYTLITGIR